MGRARNCRGGINALARTGTILSSYLRNRKGDGVRVLARLWRESLSRDDRGLSSVRGSGVFGFNKSNLWLAGPSSGRYDF